MTGSIIINTQHPLSLDTHVFDKDGNKHHFVYLEIRDRPDHKSGYISMAEEAIPKKESNQIKDIIHKHWGDFTNEECPYDYFIKGEKNIPVGRINYILQEKWKYLSKQQISEWVKDMK